METQQNFTLKSYWVVSYPRPPPCLIVFKPLPNMGCGFFITHNPILIKLESMKAKPIKKQKNQQVNKEYTAEEFEQILTFFKTAQVRHIKIDKLIITSFNHLEKQ